ncbi:hyaluronan synthase [Sinosporangium siamense]|uniref:Hyaluronan synthase n=1 Tax=Sinosporangium siamense TaxID=1367973 RepID=A0A919VA41_9ACTN|nr:hyaluronan synthase [Sinosporangium siamense]
MAIPALLLLVVAAWGATHVVSLADLPEGRGWKIVFLWMFVYLAWQLLLASLERPLAGEGEVKGPILVSVPVYNEDPALLEECLLTLLHQTRPPDLVYVVDDGSDAADYTAVHGRLQAEAAAAGIHLVWVRTPNRGKRHAQIAALTACPDAELFITLDSDTQLTPTAIAEIVKPFRDPKVMSVGGLVLTANHDRNLITRLIDLWAVSSMLTQRSALSAMRSVMVNTGSFAAYRAGLVRDHAHGYLNERFFGREVRFSDDSMLPLYALRRGASVQQPTAFAFTAMPETVGHHVRQYVRWMRGSFIRSWWRFRYLPLRSYAYWAHFFTWLHLLVSTTAFVAVVLLRPAEVLAIMPWLALVLVLLSYSQALRFLTVRRSDQTLAEQLATFALAPLVTVWSLTVLRVLRWYAIATCLNVGWNTRRTVEVTAPSSNAAAR